MRISVNKEICFISRPGDGLSYCCFQSESNPKPMPGMETEWKDNSNLVTYAKQGWESSASSTFEERRSAAGWKK